MKKILLSLAVLALVAVAGYAGTRAFFSDTEASAGNVFTAGAIDLTVDHTKAVYNGVDCQTCSVSIVSDTDDFVVERGTNAEVVTPTTVTDEYWTADVGDPNAKWIWADASVTQNDTDNTVTYTFKKDFTWYGPLTGATLALAIAADNNYEVILNGNSIHSDTSGGNSTTADNVAIAPGDIVQGVNTLEIKVTNLAQPNLPPLNNPGGLLYNLTIDGDCADTYFQRMCKLWGPKDLDDEKFFDFDDVKPGDSGSNVISLHVETNDAYACAYVENKDNLENGINDPESEVDTTAGTHEGELGDNLMFFAWRDLNQDGNFDPTGETPLMSAPEYANNLGSFAFADSASAPITAGDTSYLGTAWCAGTMSVNMTSGAITCDGADMGNESQTDSFLADLVFYAVQSRNNNGFVCGDARPSNGVSQGGTTPGDSQESGQQD